MRTTKRMRQLQKDAIYYKIECEIINRCRIFFMVCSRHFYNNALSASPHYRFTRKKSVKIAVVIERAVVITGAY